MYLKYTAETIEHCLGYTCTEQGVCLSNIGTNETEGACMLLYVHVVAFSLAPINPVHTCMYMYL